MIYFDNSASSKYKSANVINAVMQAVKYTYANAGRSGHSASLKANRTVITAREKIKTLVNAPSSEKIIFTENCSHALNLAILGSLKKGNIITTVFEHNSVLRPLFSYKDLTETTVTVLKPQNGKISASQLESAIKDDTYMVIVNHVSNVTGAEQDIESLGKICRDHDILFCVDGAQSIGYTDVDMQKCNIDILALAPHKGLHAIQGVGALVLSEKVVLRHITFGGTGTSSLILSQPDEMPEGYEVGTLPLPAIASIIPAVDEYETHKNSRQKVVSSLTRIILNELNNIDRITLYTDKSSNRGIIAFNVDGIPSAVVGDLLSQKYDICVRTGFHCAPLCHKFYGTDETGMVRVSLSFDNTYLECKTFINAIKEICKL